MKILTVIGARPQFIKAAVVSRAIETHNQARGPQRIQEAVVHTGQHYDANMSDIFFAEMSIPKPNYHLDIRASCHGAMTGRMLEEIEKIIMTENPDIVMVYGDTNTTLAGALAAAKLHIPIAHVEAGLRSYNMLMPEEINRVLTDRISSWLFCPTKTAVENLKQEGFGNWAATASKQPEICVVGDVMLDAALYYQQLAKPTNEVNTILERHGGLFYLATLHRAENVDNPVRLKTIFRALSDIAKKKAIIMPLHPRTRKMLTENGLISAALKIIDPVGYFDMITLLSHCRGVFTDSGGVQKEAYFFGKPCITLRDETEWIELVEQGFNKLVGADYDAIIEAEKNLATIKSGNTGFYGDGKAGDKIVDALLNWYKSQ